MLKLFPLPKLLLLVGLLLSACHRQPVSILQEGTAKVIYSGLITCFSGEVKNTDGSPVYCETSAVAFDGSRLIFGSDKPVPGDTLSAVFSTPLRNNDNLSNNQMTYFSYPVFKGAVKYEDFAVTPDGNYLLAITGFDRVKEQSAEFDGFNTLLCWKKDHEDAAKVVSATERNGVVSSVSLRKKISDSLKNQRFPKGPPYFKIEGLACLPDNRLLFGVREVGETYEKFDYTIQLVSVSYQIRNNELILDENFSMVYEFRPDPALLNGKTVAVSGLEFDPFNNRIYLLTSYESAPTLEGIGAFLWTLSLSALANHQPPLLVLDEKQHPLSLAHKAEGIAVLSKDQLFLIHDDDRLLGTEGYRKGTEPFFRQPNQAAYTILRIR